MAQVDKGRSHYLLRKSRKRKFDEIESDIKDKLVEKEFECKNMKEEIEILKAKICEYEDNNIEG